MPPAWSADILSPEVRGREGARPTSIIASQPRDRTIGIVATSEDFLKQVWNPWVFGP